MKDEQAIQLPLAPAGGSQVASDFVLRHPAVVKAGSKAPLLGNIAFLVRVCLGLIFIRSSLWKLYQPYEFLGDVYNYELVGPALGLYVARLLPWLELVVGICLVVGTLDWGALLIGVGLLSLFVAAQVYSLGRGLTIPCGCFNREATAISYKDVLTTGAMLVAALAGLWCSVAACSSRGRVADGGPLVG
jgi:uncharacterized membrane protein YphA (DoxX/SURF4 family)